MFNLYQRHYCKEKQIVYSVIKFSQISTALLKHSISGYISHQIQVFNCINYMSGFDLRFNRLTHERGETKWPA